jgi:hypothetical protein
MSGRWRYRLGQFWHELRAGALTEGAWTEVRDVLSLAELALFRRFDDSDRWHAVYVLRTLREAGHTQPDLLTAALLHDVGKTRVSLNVWERSLIVLVGALAPRRAAAWGAPADGPVVRGGWRKPFIVKVRHPAWGAEMAAAAGTTPRAVALIRHHQDHPATLSDPLLPLLQWADDLN